MDYFTTTKQKKNDAFMYANMDRTVLLKVLGSNLHLSCAKENWGGPVPPFRSGQGKSSAPYNLQVGEDSWAKHLRLWKQQKVVRQEGRKETEDQFHDPCGSSAGTFSDIAGRRKIFKEANFQKLSGFGVKS